MSQSTKKAGSGKPSKPHPDFPLFAHATKRWAKKVRGKLHYFGPWDDPKGALDRWLDQKDDLLAGRTPQTPSNQLTIRDLVNHFLTAKQRLLQTGDIRQRTWDDYHSVCGRLLRVISPDQLVIDLGPDDFGKVRQAFSRTRGPTCLTNDITRVRCLYKFAHDEGLIQQPVRYGQSFKRPSRRQIRQLHNGGLRLFSAQELRSLLEAAGPQMRAMILLALNCGFGNEDIGRLPLKAVDLDRACIDFPRPKTAIRRRIPLWPESVQALREWIAMRPRQVSDDAENLVFVTAKGGCWAKSAADNPVAKEFAKLQRKVGTYRRGRGFYVMRHVVQTVGDGARDPVAVAAIMGHAPASNDMAAVYREGVSEDRLQAVVAHVRQWLCGQGLTTGGQPL